jgi:lincosamide nucleotidyltransferase
MPALSPLPQAAMIERVRALCAADPRVAAALMYGSFTTGQGDAFADIEFYLFIEDDALAAFDGRAWVGQVAPVALYFTNEFGTEAVIFENLVRGEFHFAPASTQASVRGWKRTGGFAEPDKLLVLDRAGSLRPHLEAIAGPEIDPAPATHLPRLWAGFLNWMLFGVNVLARGEQARALELLGVVQRHLLWLARLEAGTTGHWPTPSRALERDLSPAVLARFAACTAPLERAALAGAYRAAWAWGGELSLALAERYAFERYPDLVARLADYFAQQLAVVEQARPADGA